MPRYFNIEQLEKETDESFARELVGMFIETTPSAIDILKIAAQKNDMHQIEQIMHKIKPSLRILHVQDLDKEAEYMEGLARNQGAIDNERLAHFVHILESCIDEMRIFLNDINR